MGMVALHPRGRDALLRRLDCGSHARRAGLSRDRMRLPRLLSRARLGNLKTRKPLLSGLQDMHGSGLPMIAFFERLENKRSRREQACRAQIDIGPVTRLGVSLHGRRHSARAHLSTFHCSVDDKSDEGNGFALSPDMRALLRRLRFARGGLRTYSSRARSRMRPAT